MIVIKNNMNYVDNNYRLLFQEPLFKALITETMLI